MRTGHHLLSRLLRSAPGWNAAYATAAISSAGASLLLPMTLGSTVDSALTGRPFPAFLLCAVLLLAALAEVAGELLDARSTVQGTAWLRYRVLRHILSLDLGGQRRFLPGEFLSRLLQSTAETARLMPAAVGSLTSLATALGGIVGLLLIDLWSGAAFLLGVPLIFIIAKGLLRRSTQLTEDYQQAHGDLAARFMDAMQGMRTIRAAGTVERETARVLAPLAALRTSGERYWRLQRDAGWLLSLIAPVVQVAVLAIAARGVMTGRVSPGELLAVTGYLTHAFGIFRQVGVLAQIGQVRGSANRLRAVLDIPPAPAGGAPLPTGKGTLSLRGVRVEAEGSPLLDGIDLTFPAGSEVAVVGRSGVGKSTLAAVAGGLLRPDAGTVRIDGADIADVDPASLRGKVVHAFEHPVLFGTTLRDAIGCADPGLADAAIASALRDSEAQRFVARLPRGLDTPLTSLRTSGGELQRLGLARAFSRDARICVLDDATSSVDVVTELQIARALRARPATRLIVTHRRSTAARADLVVWLRDGRVAGFGPHQELLADPGYRALFPVWPREVATVPAGATSPTEGRPDQ
ncbi:ABC transporter ATP-binding protein [Streptomyces coffeae]|uniref:ABC transporter ATP-binding protein n=1 Tax=Streptomyces coffeae TaxID=621382 RepID=A0ABS1NLT2_9ACTN|nr:ABC transporter ATP-binding protein [Streptomyces coffeae]MBL1101061.1 ABC transporter ATP-binding protein [Streptomyces coffeae]